MKEPVEVVILGQRLTVASEDGPAHVRDVARLVEDQLRRLSEGHRSIPLVQLALLAALNMGSDLAKLRDEVEGVNERLLRLAARIDADLEP